MDQQSLLEVLTSVAEVPESGSDTYTNEGYALYTVQCKLSRISLILVVKASDPAACWRRCLWRFHYQPGPVGGLSHRCTRLRRVFIPILVSEARQGYREGCLSR